jgi:hypothetical protein
VGTSCVLGSTHFHPSNTPHPLSMHHLVEEERPIRSGSTSSLTLAINHNTTPRPNPIVYTAICKVAMVVKDTQNGSFSSDTEPTDYCRSCTWHLSGVKHFQPSSKGGSAYSTVTCPPQTSYMRQSNYEHNAKEELHLLQEKKPKVTAM